MKNIALMGSTGSVGTQTLDIVRKYPKKLKVFALTGNKNIALLEEQIAEFQPAIIGVADEKSARDLEKRTGKKIITGPKMLEEIAAMDGYDTFISSTVGLTIIRATLKAIEKGKDIALANKETLVAAGEIVMSQAKKYGVHIMPIDSEHSALFQCLNGERMEDVRSLVITCSGGALRNYTKEQLKDVSIEDALGHKTWNMGAKITIDSATLMNKGFEVIEAMWLYDVDPENIRVVIHPESIIHSMVEYSDNSILAQISEPDMRLPIQYALSYPERWGESVKRHNFDRSYTFKEPDLEQFPCLGYAFDAMRKQGTLPAAMNAANDYLVLEFLAGRCTYLDIQNGIKYVMDNHDIINNPTLENIETAIVDATTKAEMFLGERKKM
ncbi:MAG: 1-deoxy-D-xylulose-5-phosphate reductoisomerase [Candidatus Moraniibacteriota bacterium]|nr:MAG: 1-deoxy-D-xylulose-5-phosphate reductoisomerase [Candidatus Moranbacteria bacterium]